jgi:VWFA-related protein
MKRSNVFPLFMALLAGLSFPTQNLPAQSPQAETPSQSPAAAASSPVPTVHVTTRAVLVDVIVTDKNGTPVKGLKQEDFTLLEQSKPQAVSYFEEHVGAPPDQPVEIPALPPNVFSNFSPIPTPAAVNVLLLDTLNTPLADQSYMHAQALKFLKTLKPGSRLAIFTMATRLRLIQGFTDDPAVLIAAIDNKKNLEIAPSELLKTQDEENAQQNLIGLLSQPVLSGGGTTTTLAPGGMIAALADFLQETDYAKTADRELRTLTSLQQLGAYLAAMPGRKNVIWLAGSFPQIFGGDSSQQTTFGGNLGFTAGTGDSASSPSTLLAGDPGVFESSSRTEDQVKKTILLLSGARVALYPVDVRGTKTNAFYEAGNQMPSSVQGAEATNAAQFNSLQSDAGEDANERIVMDEMARASGGKAFLNTNGLAEAMSDVVASSADFYTISYDPENQKMDGRFRRIDLKVAGGKYNLSYRRGYYADDTILPGATRVIEAKKPADSLRPFMDFGLPEAEQILYKTLVQPASSDQAAPDPTAPGESSKGPVSRYSVDFAVDLKDVKLDLQPDGTHAGSLYLSLFVYDRYGNAASRQIKLAALRIKPDAYAAFQQTGLQLRAMIEVPKGQFWLRTGLYDPATHKVGTLEIPISAVKPEESAAR